MRLPSDEKLGSASHPDRAFVKRFAATILRSPKYMKQAPPSSCEKATDLPSGEKLTRLNTGPLAEPRQLEARSIPIIRISNFEHLIIEFQLLWRDISLA